jgi:aminocarboxymuconate-semialdehyde decarboxylase
MPAARSLKAGPLDVHAHIMPERLIERIAAGERAGFAVEVTDKGRFVRLGERGPRLSVLPGMADMDIRLKTMAEQGVSAQLLSPWIALAAYHLGEDDAVWFATALNEEIAAVVAAHPDRFIGVGSVPLQAPAKAVEMLGWMMRDLGLFGVEISTSVRPDMLLDDPALEPFWAEAERLDAFVMIHPSLGGTGRPEFEKYYLNNLIHNPLDTTVAAAHIMFSGLLERYPRLKILLVHGGGFLPYDIGRLRRGHLVRPETKVAMKGSVDDSYEKFLFDTVTHSVSQLRFLVGEVGPERVLLGSDYPFDMADPVLVETVHHAAFGPDAETAITRGNADRLFS